MLVSRQPLQTLPMSSSQRQQRTIHSRLHDKDDAPIHPSRFNASTDLRPPTASRDSKRSSLSRTVNEKKRKMDYDEDDDGFLFTRVKKNKSETSAVPQPSASAQPVTAVPQKVERGAPKPGPATEDEPQPAPKKRGKRLSFSTPNPKDNVAPRRSKRLSREHDPGNGSPISMSVKLEKPKPQKSSPSKSKRKSPAKTVDAAQQKVVPQQISSEVPEQAENVEVAVPESKATEVVTATEKHSETKIALPFADTPVIKRNKAMREDNHRKGERRSSLGMRGRRASSLIETGNSNALPHHEVAIPDFYKHIESDGLPEPRRMRQLLTWCGTRALDEKPMGTDFEDSSARSAARVIEEELLKDLANRSELSDWFSREELAVQQKPLPERPNPKNVQNLEKIGELETQIKRLRAEKEALESLLRPPSLPPRGDARSPEPDRSLLSASDLAAVDVLTQNPMPGERITQELNAVFESVGPTIDSFADSIHKIGQYRTAADNVADRVLAMCAEMLEQREKQGLKRALMSEQGEKTPPKDLVGVLRSLSRVER
ncbi:hypothetical protein PV10_02386 [Exophiala mesophila]|uniref:Mis12-Mtw1 family protein n=1 Tax=Exophiala mesophila TaxID=212818 RepID=A0A0D2A6M0_EXOME|nr:uncharacterized protein PV10_02386 [Exophiala mesophila]KIV94638.1 hypothetical protein PV10_02386 [Exophiala mesophila]